MIISCLVPGGGHENARPGRRLQWRGGQVARLVESRRVSLLLCCRSAHGNVDCGHIDCTIVCGRDDSWREAATEPAVPHTHALVQTTAADGRSEQRRRKRYGSLEETGQRTNFR